MHLSETKKMKMQSLLKGNVWRQFKATLQGGARKAKVSERPKNVDIQHNHSHEKRKDSVFQTVFPFLMTILQFKNNLQKKKEKAITEKI